MNVSMFVLNLELLEIFLHFRKLAVKNLNSIFSCFSGVAFSRRATISSSAGSANPAAILNFSTHRI